MKITTILSGFEVGTDRGALQATIDCNLIHGSELIVGEAEHELPRHLSYYDNLEINARKADATLIFPEDNLSPIELKISRVCAGENKPCLLVRRSWGVETAVEQILKFLNPLNGSLLNIMGASEMASPGQEEFVRRIMIQVCLVTGVASGKFDKQ